MTERNRVGSPGNVAIMAATTLATTSAMMVAFVRRPRAPLKSNNAQFRYARIVPGASFVAGD